MQNKSFIHRFCMNAAGLNQNIKLIKKNSSLFTKWVYFAVTFHVHQSTVNKYFCLNSFDMIWKVNEEN